RLAKLSLPEPSVILLPERSKFKVTPTYEGGHLTWPRSEFSLEKIWHSSDTKRDAVHSAPFLILVASRFRLMRRALIEIIRGKNASLQGGDRRGWPIAGCLSEANSRISV